MEKWINETLARDPYQYFAFISRLLHNDWIFIQKFSICLLCLSLYFFLSFFSAPHFHDHFLLFSIFNLSISTIGLYTPII